MSFKSSITSRQARYGLNSTLYILAAVAIVVIVNLLAIQAPERLGKYNTNWQWDLTANKRFSLSPQTLQVLSKLNKNIQLIYFDRKDNLGADRDLLEQFPLHSSRVTVSYLDPDRDRAKAAQYGVKDYGKIIVAAGDKFEEAKGTTEEAVINSIIRVLKGGTENVYFLEGHGERDIASTERLGYSEAKKALEDTNYQVKTLSLLEEKPAVPADCKVLVIAGPQKEFLDPEIDAIKKYMMGGGRVFFLLTPFTPEKLVKMLAEFGVDATNTLVVDESGVGRLFGTDELMPIALQYTNQPITKDLTNTATLFPFANAVGSASGGIAGSDFQVIAKTAPQSWASLDVHAKKVSFRQGKDIKGPLGLAGAGTFQDPGSPTAVESRYVVSGSADLISNAILGFNGNRDLFLNMMNWLSSDEDLIAVRPKDPEERPVDLNPTQISMIWYMCFVAVPLGVILGGLGVWWRRRN